MAIITLTTDLGIKDYYVALLKAEILKCCTDANIIDISHQVEPFDIFQAAFLIKNCYKEFPEGTIHIIGMDSGSKDDRRYLIGINKKQYFIGPDNGVLSLIFDGNPEMIYSINIEEEHNSIFPSRAILTRAACHLARGQDVKEISKQVENMVEKTILQPVVKDSVIQGNVIYIDSFRNIIVNIDKDLFDRIGQGRPVRISYHKREYIDRISKDYSEVPEGEALSLFGSSGYLEIALNMAPASSLLGIQVGETIQVEFL